ncbi:type II toxin-antitoxin system HicA family toxin [uncultured Thiohalocapsa sp.]|uniref:type II toxin-antitoxin system HicA family toxin n=1 Tax=uncultured Thiohalocapsa sp. TaxID=768990 RepID=UPI0025F0B396|nr:type II toxin-antitoxin system HicA family toxin [uncultured Thiohalocapsa sp.]
MQEENRRSSVREGRKTGGSHFMFLHPDCELAVTVPFKRPITPVYIQQFLALLEELGVDQ